MDEINKLPEADEIFEITISYEEKGKEIGIEMRTKEIAIQMLKRDLDLDLIAELTGLGINEINELRQQS